MSFLPKISTHDVDEVAAFLKKSKASVYSDLSRNPGCLPPTLNVPGSSRVLFVNLHQWAASLIHLPAAAQPAEVEIAPIKKKRGRPSNLELQRRLVKEKKGGAA